MVKKKITIQKQKPEKSYALVTERLVYAILIISILSLIVSSYSLYELKKATKPPKTLSMEEFLTKLTAHEELKELKGINPVNIIRIDNVNLANLQSQIQGLDISYIGDYIIQYPNALIIYNIDNDEIKGIVNPQAQASQMPADFFDKLTKHPEASGKENEAPQGGILDKASLDTLKEQMPDVYKDAKEGDFLLRYSDVLIIYDYNNDKIVNSVKLQ